MGLYAVRFDVYFRPKEVIEVPGFSVKFLKSLIINYDSEGLIKDLILSGGANKPLHLSPIMVGGKALLHGDQVRLLPSTKYWFRLGIICTEDLLYRLSEFLVNLVSKFGELLSIEVTSEHLEVLNKAPKEFMIEVLTPAVIKAKDSTLVKYPTLKELLSTPIKVLGRVLWEKYSINIPTTWIWRISSYHIMTTSKSEVTKVDIGKGRVVEGITGRWGFKRVSEIPKYLEAILAKTLAIANTIGVGKSRAIGFGTTNIKIKT